MKASQFIPFIKVALCLVVMVLIAIAASHSNLAAPATAQAMVTANLQPVVTITKTVNGQVETIALQKLGDYRLDDVSVTRDGISIGEVAPLPDAQIRSRLVVVMVGDLPIGSKVKLLSIRCGEQPHQPVLLCLPAEEPAK